MNYTKANDIKEEVKKVIKEEKMEYIDIEDIEVVRADKDIKNGEHLELGRCIALSPLTVFLSNKKYTLQFPPAFDLLENNIDKRMIIHHELKHIPKDLKHIQTHDFEEFSEIIEKYPNRIYNLIKDVEKKVEVTKLESKMKKIIDKK